jgi:bacterioferritin-associated ferredoxin
MSFVLKANDPMQSLIIDQLCQIAEKRGGSCLSKIYEGSKSKLLWQCSEGHKWVAAPAAIKRGTWCPECAGKKKRTIEEMHQLAKERGGKCLSGMYKDANTRLLWECSEKHQWETAPKNIKSGTWCPSCARAARPSIRRKIADMQKVAAERSGKCMSDVYRGSQAKLRWECSKGHQWTAVLGSIAHGSWCPTCARNAKHTIEDMQIVAAKRGGKCLSDSYKNNCTKLTWECSEGHQWNAMPMKVFNGNWCRKCHIAKRYNQSNNEQYK